VWQAFSLPERTLKACSTIAQGEALGLLETQSRRLNQQERGNLTMNRTVSRLVRVLSCAVIGSALFSAAGNSAAWEIPLAIENQNRSGIPPYISGGVPLLPGQAKEPAGLALAVKGADGKLTAVASQFRPLARWWRQDNSLRWVLVDFAASDVPGENKVVYLTDSALPAPAGKASVSVEDKGDTLVVSTGPAVFTVNRKGFNFLQSAVINGTEMLAGGPETGTVIEDVLGQKYYSADGTREVTVIDAGPVRVCIRARGQHLPREGKGYSRGMYGYDVFLNFYAGSTDVGADVVIHNNFQKSIGEPLMKDCSLLVKLAGPGQVTSGICKIYGAAPFASNLYTDQDGESICLYQDSNGAETWQVCQGYSGESSPGGQSYGGKATSFRGYRIYRRGKGGEETVAGGDHARGLIHLTTGTGGAVLLMRNFWQQFPKAVEGSRDGTLRLGLFPRECAAPHYLDDCAAKGHEIVLHFYAKGKSGYASDGEGRTWPHVFADIWDIPAFPRPPIEHIAACGALTDVGPFTVPVSGFADYDTAVNLRRLMMTDEYHGNGLGWQVYGERWTSHGGHSRHGARQPIKEDDFLYRWYVTGGCGWLDAGINRSRLFRDVRAYRIDDQDALSFANWNDFRNANTSESREWTKRPIPADEELAKYRQGVVMRARWEFPNPEHCTLDLLYDRYLLFGDVRAFENMRVVAGHGGYFALGYAPGIHRSNGWSWRALERYWELTGDKRSEEMLNQIVTAYASKLTGKAPLWSGDAAKPNEWFTQVWTRAVAMTALHTRNREAIELAKTAAEGKENRANYFCTLFSVLYHLTGDEKYKEAVMNKTDGGRKLLVVHDNGDFPATADWLLAQPPAK
jgi:hypothetical protein